MNANVNNSVNANNSNINAMDANNIEFVCSRCGSKHITACPKGEEELPQFTEVGDTLFIKGGVTEMIIHKDNEVSKAIARNIDQLPQDLVLALKNVGAYDLLFNVTSGIEEGGYIQRPEIVKRFLPIRAITLAQRDGAMADYLRLGGYRYALKVMEDQLNLMTHMEANNDIEALEECRMIWTDDVFAEAIDHWCDELEKARQNRYRIHRCKGRKYIKIHYARLNDGKGIFLDEWEDFVSSFRIWKNRFFDMSSYHNKLSMFKMFVRKCNKTHWTPSQSKAFENAFRAAGGYYTLKSLILFDGVRLEDDPRVDQLALLKAKYEEKCGVDGSHVTTDGYKMFGYLKHVLKENKFDFEATKRKWYEASEARKEARRNYERRSRN